MSRKGFHSAGCILQRYSSTTVSDRCRDLFCSPRHVLQRPQNKKTHFAGACALPFPNNSAPSGPLRHRYIYAQQIADYRASLWTQQAARIATCSKKRGGSIGARMRWAAPEVNIRRLTRTCVTIFFSSLSLKVLGCSGTSTVGTRNIWSLFAAPGWRWRATTLSPQLPYCTRSRAYAQCLGSNLVEKNFLQRIFFVVYPR